MSNYYTSMSILSSSSKTFKTEIDNYISSISPTLLSEGSYYPTVPENFTATLVSCKYYGEVFDTGMTTRQFGSYWYQKNAGMDPPPYGCVLTLEVKFTPTDRTIMEGLKASDAYDEVTFTFDVSFSLWEAQT